MIEERPGDAFWHSVALAAATIFALTPCVIALVNDPSGWFSFHPPFLSVAVWATTYGILTLQPTSRPKSKAEGLQRHQFWMLVASASMLLGTGFIVYNKYIHGKAHFTSWHGLFGITAIAWLSLQVIVGAGSVWYGGRMFGGGAKAKRLWKYHRLSGYLLYAVFLAISYLGGAWSGWTIRNSAHWVRIVAFTICIPAMLVAVSSRARLSKMNFR